MDRSTSRETLGNPIDQTIQMYQPFFDIGSDTPIVSKMNQDIPLLTKTRCKLLVMPRL